MQIKKISGSQFTPQEYTNLLSDPLPYTTKSGFTIQELEGECPNCKNKIEDIKQTITEYSNHTLIRPVGVCHNCKLVVTTHPIRIDNNNKITILINGQWWEIKENILDKIMKWFSNQ